MGKCVRIRTTQPPPSSPGAAGADPAAAYLTLRSGRRVPVAAYCSPRRSSGRRHRCAAGSPSSERRCGAKRACSGSPRRRVPGGSHQLSGGRPEELPPPTPAKPLAHDAGGCNGGDSLGYGPNAPVSGDAVMRAKHGDERGSKGRGVAGHHQPPPAALQAEMEAFFAAAELAERRRFAETYNYDVALDRPLEGRFEWAPASA